MTTFDAALPLVAAASVVLDEAQQRVVDARRTPGAIVLGAPGSGKTTAVVELVAAAVLDDGLAPSSVLVLTPSRRTATLLRDRLALRLADSGDDTLAHRAPGALPGPLARSVAAYAFSIVTAAHRLGGLAEPRLLSGADHDADLAELPWVARQTLVLGARIPVLKLASKIGVAVDITISASPQHTGLMARDLVLSYLQALPQLAPLVVVLKSFLRDLNLNDVYTGGLSSYCLVVLLFSFMRECEQYGYSTKDCGHLLIGFFNHFL